ncbi:MULTISPECIES: hypothetical protein [unclassified Roseibium]|uniref:hypothetical protein n=1 Tax=unclassified Roseibium TaxID=2629323 RepID=UPI00273F1516|nr:MULTISPECIES: hypothetical protein [unclassified Roseibium]
MAPRKGKQTAAQQTAQQKTAPAVSAQKQDPVAQQLQAQPGAAPDTVPAAAPATPPALVPAKPGAKADPAVASDQVIGVVMSPIRHDGMAFAIGDPIALEASVFAGLEKAGVVKPD